MKSAKKILDALFDEFATSVDEGAGISQALLLNRLSTMDFRNRAETIIQEQFDLLKTEERDCETLQLEISELEQKIYTLENSECDQCYSYEAEIAQLKREKVKTAREIRELGLEIDELT